MTATLEQNKELAKKMEDLKAKDININTLNKKIKPATAADCAERRIL